MKDPDPSLEGAYLWTPFIGSAALAAVAGLGVFNSLIGVAGFCALLCASAAIQLYTQLRSGYALQATLIARYSRTKHPVAYRYTLLINTLAVGGFAYGGLSSLLSATVAL